MATVLQQKCPEMGAIRFHAYDNEARAIRRQEKDSAVEDEDKDNATDKAEDKVGDAAADNADDAETQRLFCVFLAELQQTRHYCSISTSRQLQYI